MIDFGWYGKMRHPSYTGVLVYFLALVLLLNNWLSLFATLLPIYFVFFYRIYIEEQELRKHFETRHDKYRQQVPYLIISNLF